MFDGAQPLQSLLTPPPPHVHSSFATPVAAHSLHWQARFRCYRSQMLTTLLVGVTFCTVFGTALATEMAVQVPAHTYTHITYLLAHRYMLQACAHTLVVDFGVGQGRTDAPATGGCT